jgi:hypothetical protein
MIRIVVYLGLTGFGLVATLCNPLAGAITCLEAYLLNPGIFVDGVRFQLITTIAFLASCMLYQPRGAPRVGAEGSVLTALWAFTGIGALTSLWAVVDSQLALDTTFELAKTILMISLIVRVIRTEAHLSIVSWACLIGLSHGAFAHTFGVKFGYVPASFALDSGVFPDSQGSVVELFVPMFLLLAAHGTRYERVFSFLALPVVCNSIITTHQRTYFLVMAVECVLLVLLLPKKAVRRLLPILAVGCGVVLFRLTPSHYWEWYGTIADPTNEASANGRFTLAEVSGRMLMDHPMGVGAGNFTVVSPQYLPAEALTEGKRSSHNAYTTVACENGFLGFGLWAYAFAAALWILRRIRKSVQGGTPNRIELYAMGLEVGLLGWLVGGLTQGDSGTDPAYWFVALSVVLRRLHYQAELAPVEDG